MTFPNDKYPDPQKYASDYFKKLSEATSGINKDCIAQSVSILEDTFEKNRRLFVCGNGGSASISNHLACDHGKLLATDTDLIPQVYSLSTNIEVITAIANDICFEDIFVHQLKFLASKKDTLVTISSSGDSENIVRAAEWAINNNLSVISLTGFDVGRSANLASVNLHVSADNYGLIEDAHQSLMHLMGQYLRQKRMSKETIKLRKF